MLILIVNVEKLFVLRLKKLRHHHFYYIYSYALILPIQIKKSKISKFYSIINVSYNMIK